MGTTMSNDADGREHFETIDENSDNEILNTDLIHPPDSVPSGDEQKNEDGEQKNDTNNSDKIYCVSLDGEPIFYLKDKTDDEIKNILNTYAKKICTRAQRHYPDLLFYIDEDDNFGVEITTVHKFVLIRYETTYCKLRCKQLSQIN